MATLEVTIHNICLIVIWDHGTELWMLDDDRHRPYLLDADSRPKIDLTGALVEFGDGDPGAGGQVFATAKSDLSGRRVDYYDVLRLVPDAALRSTLAPGTDDVDGPIAARIRVNGGDIRPVSGSRIGDGMHWTIGTTAQNLTSLSVFTRQLSNDRAFVRVSRRHSEPEDIVVHADAGGVCRVSLGAFDITNAAALAVLHGEAFVQELSALDRVLSSPSRKAVPIPHAYWPEYEECARQHPAADPSEDRVRLTDPCGGPCPGAVLDLRTQPDVVRRAADSRRTG